ncbi:MAG: AMP-binding protein [Pseudomonas sp.]|nr:AMP-binding protein [Pseudomonas sp.]
MSWIDLQHLLLQQHSTTLAGPEPLAHADLTQQALSLAAGLQDRSIQQIAVHLLDAGDLAVVLLGAWRAGVTVVLPADLQEHTRQRLNTQVDAWITNRAELSALYAEPLAPAALDLDAQLLILSTSGSSGEPKLIGKTLRQLNNELCVLEELWGAVLGSATVLGSVITQHIYGLLFRLLWPLCAGRYLLRLPLPFPEDIQQASLSGPSVHEDFTWVASPALLKRMGDNLDWPALRAVRKVFSSGGPLPTDAAELIEQRLHQRPVEIYGSSETGGIAWRQIETLWQPLPGVRLALNTDGALRINSPWLALGQTEQTADAAKLYADGRFALQGRLDRIIKLEEKRISLPFLEQQLCLHEWVSDVRLGVVTEGRASLGALLVLSASGVHALRNQGRRAVTQGLREYLKDFCEPLALPRRWRLIEQLPLNPQGKLPQAEVDRQLLLARAKLPFIVKQQKIADEWQLDLQIPLDLAIFSGHFPTAPVVPGVVQVDWAFNIAQELMDIPPRFCGMEVVKFLQLLRPGDSVRLTLSFDQARSKLHFSYNTTEARCSSGRILLGSGDV